MSPPNLNSNQRFVAGLFDTCRPRKIRTMLQWACDELIIPDGPFSGMRFNPTRQPYAQLMLPQMGRWRRHNITGPTQSGKSLTAYILPILYHLFERGESVICGLPTLDMAANKWQKDLRPAIEATRYRNLIPRRGPGSQGGTPTEVIFGNGASLLFMTGGGNDKQRAGATAPVVVITETDGMDEIGGTSREADKITQLEVRTNAYQAVGRDRIYMECTVSTEDGRTWVEYQGGTQSRLAVPCRHCGHWVTPEREDLIGWQEAESKVEAGQKSSFACPDCGGFLSEQDRRQMNESAILVHHGQEVTESGEVIGEPPLTDTFSFRWNAFNNLFTTAQRLGELEWAASRSEDPESSELKMRQFFWTQPAKNDRVEKTPISIAVVRGSDRNYVGRCSGDPRGVIPADCDMLTAFIDCGKRELEWSVEAKIGKRIHVVDYGIFETDIPDVKGEEKAVEDAIRDLTEEIESRFPDLDCGLVDSGNWGDVIRATVSSLPSVWNPSHGLSNYKHPSNSVTGSKELPQDGCEHWHWSMVSGVWVASFNPDVLKHLVHSGYMIRPLKSDGTFASGCVTLWGESPDNHTDFAKEITAEEWVTEFVPGKGVVAKWKPVRRRNHFLDTSVGNKLARLVVANWRYTEQSAGGQEESPRSIQTPDGRPFFVGNR